MLVANSGWLHPMDRWIRPGISSSSTHRPVQRSHRAKSDRGWIRKLRLAARRRGMANVDAFLRQPSYDVEDDGTREIIRVNRSCDPSCADGPVTFSTFAWNGSDYFTELCTSPQRPPLAIQATSGAGGTVMGQIPAGTCEVYSNVSEYINEVEWNAVWFADVSGWAPAASFQPAPSEPPYPVEENEVVEITAPAPPPAPNELLPPRSAPTTASTTATRFVGVTKGMPSASCSTRCRVSTP